MGTAALRAIQRGMLGTVRMNSIGERETEHRDGRIDIFLASWFEHLPNYLFRNVTVSAALIYAGFFGLIFLLPIDLQSLRGFSASQSGLAQAPPVRDVASGL